MANPDIQIRTPSGSFRLRVVALIIRDGKLLAVKAENHDTYYTVGGRIHLGESSKQAVIREAFEETGLHLEIDRLLFVQESCFTFQGTLCHEVAFHYLMKTPQADIPEGSHTDQISETLHWLPVDSLPSLPLIPAFLKEALQHLPDEVVHIAAWE